MVAHQKCTSRKQNLSNAGNIVFEHKKTYLFKTYLTWITHFSSMGTKRIDRPGTKGPSWVWIDLVRNDSYKNRYFTINESLARLTFETSPCSIYDLLSRKRHAVNLNTRYPATEVPTIANFCTHTHGSVCRQTNFPDVRPNNWSIIHPQCGHSCVSIERCTNEIPRFVSHVVAMGYERCGEATTPSDKPGKELSWFCHP